MRGKCSGLSKAEPPPGRYGGDRWGRAVPSVSREQGRPRGRGAAREMGQNWIFWQFLVVFTFDHGNEQPDRTRLGAVGLPG